MIIQKKMAQRRSTWRFYCWATDRYGYNKVWTAFHVRVLTLLFLCGAVFMAGFILSGVAKANNSMQAKVTVFWTGTPCIHAVQVDGTADTICGNYHEYVNYTTNPGDVTGVNPIMGLATTLSCNFYLNNILVYSDLAIRGDGHDVNCMRRINGKGLMVA